MMVLQQAENCQNMLCQRSLSSQQKKKKKNVVHIIITVVMGRHLTRLTPLLSVIHAE